MKRSLLVEFQEHSQDFLRLLGEKNRQAERSQTAADELARMEFFWDGIEAIITEYEKRLHEHKLLAVNEHVKAILLREELKTTYNELYVNRHKIPDVIAKLMKSTKIPSEKELRSDVNLKHGKQD